MKTFFRFLEDINYMRMVVGICILIDGYPLIFFFRETLGLAPGSTVFTAVAFAGGLLLMIPFTILRRLYRPNMTMFWIGVSFIGLCLFYMYFYNGVSGFIDYNRDLIYYVYILIFLFLLINVPNEIIRVFIPAVILFTLVSNLGLIYSLITNPTWVIGQRAVITVGDTDDGAGNPHVFARNAVMGLVACTIWLVRPQIGTLFKLFCFFSALISLAILILTQTRSAILAMLIAASLFVYYNVRPAQIKSAAKSLFSPATILIIFVGIVAINLLIERYYDVYGIIYGYVLSFAERNLENIYAFLGFKVSGTNYKAVLDDSVANRTLSGAFFLNAVAYQPYMMIFGFGYKYAYLDVPLLEAATSMGLLGFFLFGAILVMSLHYSLRAMRRNPNPLNTFLAYFYIYILVSAISGGRPYDITFWFPLSLMIRFMGIDYLFAAHLHNQPVLVPNPDVSLPPQLVSSQSA